MRPKWSNTRPNAMKQLPLEICLREKAPETPTGVHTGSRQFTEAELSKDCILIKRVLKNPKATPLRLSSMIIH